MKKIGIIAAIAIFMAGTAFADGVLSPSANKRLTVLQNLEHSKRLNQLNYLLNHKEEYVVKAISKEMFLNFPLIAVDILKDEDSTDLIKPLFEVGLDFASESEMSFNGFVEVLMGVVSEELPKNNLTTLNNVFSTLSSNAENLFKKCESKIRGFKYKRFTGKWTDADRRHQPLVAKFALTSMLSEFAEAWVSWNGEEKNWDVAGVLIKYGKRSALPIIFETLENDYDFSVMLMGDLASLVTTDDLENLLELYPQLSDNWIAEKNVEELISKLEVEVSSEDPNRVNALGTK